MWFVFVFSMDESLVRLYGRVGAVVRDSLGYALSIVEPGMSVLELCERVEGRIRSGGVRLAFPLNVSVNDVAAHYTARVRDEYTIPRGSVVKIDAGAHVDGYIVDAAVTVSFNPVYNQLIKAVIKALDSAQSALRVGNTLGSVGAYIEKAIRSFGFRPVENLSGHLIRRYELHAGKSIPNVDNGDRQRIREDEVYAVEPFATNGKGRVEDSPPVTIYRLVKSDGSELLRYISEEVGPLPFTPRWLVPRFGEDAEALVEDLYRSGKLYGYPTLVEAGGGLVAQVEDTFIVTREGPIPTVNVLDLLK
jgi:methionyl aminopeptidase